MNVSPTTKIDTSHEGQMGPSVIQAQETLNWSSQTGAATIDNLEREPPRRDVLR